MRLFQAPGRANLIGDHIDYMGGLVLPMAIDRGTWLWAEARDDTLIRGSSVNFPESGTIEVDINTETYDKDNGWTNYLAAMAYALRKRGAAIPHGFDVRVRGDIPNGAGLSSSASIELAFGVALNSWFDLGFTPTELAQAGQVAENEFIGVSSGIMDQLIIANGRRGYALAMDCQTLEVSPVPMPSDDVVIVADSGKRRGLVESAYNERRAAAEKAQRELGGGRLVDLAPEDLDAALTRLDPSLRGPARHVATEQHRVLEAVAALKAGDDARMGELMRQSHESLRDDYRVTGAELDALAAAAWEAPGCLGARMTGAGFGGCTVNLVRADAVDAFVDFVGPRYTEATGLDPRFFVVRADAGAREITDPAELEANPAPPWGGGVIEAAIGNLVDYGVGQGLIGSEDRAYVRNRLIEVLQIEDYDLAAEKSDSETADCADTPIDDLLAPLLDYGVARGLIEPDTTTERDLWDTAIMGAFVMHPSVISDRFWTLHKQVPAAATDYFHHLSVASNYVRTGRTERDICWKQDTAYGRMDITINLSKPEKDPRDIAKAATKIRSAGHQPYPANLLVRDNEGYPGRTGHPARQNLRLIPMELGGERWYLQYSPYEYYDQHAIVLSEAVRPMHIDGAAFARLADFVDTIPHYFVGSNADLPIVGGSILSQDHFQGGAYEFALDRASVDAQWDLNGISVEVLRWPLTVLRLRGPRAPVLTRATELLAAWREYSDPQHGVLAYTGDIPHNTITPIARLLGGQLQLTLCLRNNRTSAEHPDGIFHPHAEIHPIKRENIGLIEAMGLAVLPARLATELDELALALVTGSELSEEMSPHQRMLDALRVRYPESLTMEEAIAVVRSDAGDFFVRGLEHCGVFGDEAVDGCARFLATLGWIRP